MSLQNYFDNFCTGYWVDEDPAVCACHGHGWAISDVDTVHKCRVHYTGQPHPEDADREEGVPTSSPVTVGDPALVPADDIGDDEIPF